MGKTVNGAVGAIVEPVKNTVTNIVTDVKGGKPLAAVGDLVGGTGSGTDSNGSGVLGLAKGVIVGAGANAGKGLVADVTSNPTAAIASGVQAYATGGASLLAGAEQSVLSSAGALSPGQLQKAGTGGGAPVLPVSNPASAGVYSGGAGGSDFTMIAVLGAGAVLLVMLLKR